MHADGDASARDQAELDSNSAEEPPSAYAAQQASPADDAALQQIRRKGEGQYGCKHYRRRVLFITPCCDEEFWCRHCHNEAKYQQEQDWKKKHELDRKLITEVVCALCRTRQAVSDHCSSCGAAFGAYSCTKCPFYDDDLTKKAYHCEDCGICRIGGRDNYFHCKTCASCYSINLKDNHKCVDRAMHQNCPVCFEYLFESVDPTTVLVCGHTIHAQCLKDLEASQSGICPSCPICKKSLGDYSRYWRHLDRQIEGSRLPLEYVGWRADILCNDCSESATIPFHIVGLKCPHCRSYNTRRMGLHTTAPTPATSAGAPVAGPQIQQEMDMLVALLGGAAGVQRGRMPAPVGEGGQQEEGDDDEGGYDDEEEDGMWETASEEEGGQGDDMEEGPELGG